jgi:MGT family glycosyltransferase
LEIKDPELPPTFSGLPLEDRTDWEAFRTEYAAQVGDLQATFSDFCVERGAPPLPAMEMIHESPWLNLYLYPRELDYPRGVALGRTWRNLETCVRATDAPWEPPDLGGERGRLIYLSLGSLGSADVELMRQLVALLADTPHRYIVSRGPRHDEYDLADNMVGEEFLPQTSVLPQVDAVITHGGNNTVTECMWFGKPMLVLPIFWDQHDNAQRVHETGYGLRLPTYALDHDRLVKAIDRLLTDGALRERSREAGARLRERPGTEVAANLIERVARSGEPAQFAVAG